MEDIVTKLRETFREEAYELIAELEAALLELEQAPRDQELIGRVFRALHTIKGSGAACELNDISAFTHELETLFDKVRKGQVSATKEIIALILSARDQIKAMFDECYYGKSIDDQKTRQLLASIKKAVPAAGDTGESIPPPPHDKTCSPRNSSGASITYRIRFRPARNFFIRGINPFFLLNDLRQLGNCRVVAQIDAIPYLDDYDPEACYTYWDVILTTCKGINAIYDVFLLIKDEVELSINVIDAEGSLDDEVSYKKIGEILIDRGDLLLEDLRKVLQAKKRVGEMLVETGLVTESKVQSALIEQQTVRDIRKNKPEVDATASIRVSTDRLDTLANLVGELVTVQARLSQTASSHGNTEFITIAEEVERLTAGIRDNTMSIRMLPIGTTFSKFKRLVRDLSQELSKEVELTTAGAETELDKTVIERLSEPLMHLIRNSIDHGIEKAAVREAADKPRTGTIHLSAVHSGATVLIRIQDDGAGLDVEAIRAKAVEKGIIRPDAALSEKELFQLILIPDLSTAKAVSNVSGRGVGMDIVRKAIDALHGTIDISSTRGKGTTITLKLPLTLAIIDGFLTKIGAEHFIFPLSSVEECIELTRETAANAKGRHLVNVRGSIVPFIRLREEFKMGTATPAIEQIVIVRENDRRIGFVVDTVIGEHQTVLKSLGRFYKDVEVISGATILGDGTVALVLEIPRLIRAAELEESVAYAEGIISGSMAQVNTRKA
jgi:two-component system chemotaxis sensor kinase CheA